MTRKSPEAYAPDEGRSREWSLTRHDRWDVRRLNLRRAWVWTIRALEIFTFLRSGWTSSLSHEQQPAFRIGFLAAYEPSLRD
jgi:hypothetical protein